MEWKDIFKDYTVPVEESEWADIAKDAKLVRFNRLRHLRRVALFGIVPAVFVAAVIAVTVGLSSKSTTETKPSNKEFKQEQITRSEQTACSNPQDVKPTSQQNDEPAAKVENTEMSAISALPQTVTSTQTPTPTVQLSTVTSKPVEQTKTVPAVTPAKPAVSAVSESLAPVVSAKSSKPSVTKTKAVASSENNTSAPVNNQPQTSDYEMFIPNAFTPNGDGVNDLFKVEAGFEPRTFEIAIYSRKGELVFLNRDMKIGWDGTFRGRTLPGETYSYIVKFTDPEGKQSSKRGQVTLIR